MDSRELREKAGQLFSKGKFAKAAEAWEDFCKAEPKDFQAKLRMGDAWLKAGTKEKAAQAYVSAAEGFAKEGFLPRAIAASKLVLEIDPKHKAVQTMLAQLYAQKPSGPGRPSTPKAVLPPVVSAPTVPLETPNPPVEAFSETAPALVPHPTPSIDISFDVPAPEAVQIEIDVETSSASSVEIEIEIPVPSEAQSPNGFKAQPRVASSFTELDFDTDTLLLSLSGPPTSSPSALVQAEELPDAHEDVAPGALPTIPLFSDLPQDAFIALFEKCHLKQFSIGESAIRQGERGDAFYVICSGRMRVTRSERKAGQPATQTELAQLEEGQFFGEMALLSHAARVATVEAMEEGTQVLEIPSSTLKELSSQHPSIAVAIKKFCRQRMLSNVMNSARLFAPFSRQDRRELVQKFKSKDVQSGQVILKEGQLADGLYVVLSGEVEVSVAGQVLARLCEGEIFGEMSLLQRTPASASVCARKHSSLLRLPKEDFDRLILTHPQVLELVSELTDERTKANASML
jgi:CRP-like cAMP-binding protein